MINGSVFYHMHTNLSFKTDTQLSVNSTGNVKTMNRVEGSESTSVILGKTEREWIKRMYGPLCWVGPTQVRMHVGMWDVQACAC